MKLENMNKFIKTMKFTVMLFSQIHFNDVDDCYFCVGNPAKRRKGKNAKPIEYPNLTSSAPISPNLPIPETLKQFFHIKFISEFT